MSLKRVASKFTDAPCQGRWALEAPFANMTGVVAVVLLIVTAPRNDWAVTLAIAGRGR